MNNLVQQFAQLALAHLQALAQDPLAPHPPEEPQQQAPQPPAPPAPAQVMAANRAGVCLLLPDTYDGVKNALHIHGWIFSVECYVNLYHLEAVDALGMVQALLRHEAALRWLATEKHVANGTILLVDTLAHFFLLLKEEFEPKDYKQEA